MDVVNQFLEYLMHERGRSANTISAYKKDLEQFIAILEDSNALVNNVAIADNQVERYLEWLKAQDFRPSTIARKCTAVRGFLEFANKEDVLSLTYLDSYLRNLSPTRNPPNVLTVNAIKTLLAAPTKFSSPLALRDAAILSLMYETGIRAANVVKLLVDEYDPLGVRILISSVRSSYFPLGEASNLLDIYIKDGRPHLARIPEELHLFLNQRGKGLTRQGIWFMVKHWAKEVNLSSVVSPNTIRHSLIQHLLDSGFSNREVLRKLGLKSPNSLRAFYYSHRKLGDE